MEGEQRLLRRQLSYEENCMCPPSIHAKSLHKCFWNIPVQLWCELTSFQLRQEITDCNLHNQLTNSQNNNHKMRIQQSVNDTGTITRNLLTHLALLRIVWIKKDRTCQTCVSTGIAWCWSREKSAIQAATLGPIPGSEHSAATASSSGCCLNEYSQCSPPSAFCCSNSTAPTMYLAL